MSSAAVVIAALSVKKIAIVPYSVHVKVKVKVSHSLLAVGAVGG